MLVTQIATNSSSAVPDSRCGPNDNADDCKALCDLYDATNGPGWTKQYNFCQGTTYCCWNEYGIGVTCDNAGRVSQL